MQYTFLLNEHTYSEAIAEQEKTLLMNFLT